MRIDAYSQVSQIYQANKLKKTVKTSETRVKDQYQISRSGRDYQIAKQALSEVPDVREDKVAALKEAFASGTYNVSSQEIAESMVSRFYDTLA